MKTTHTPGPWRYDRANGSPTTGEHMIAGAKPGYLAEVRDCGSGDVSANARLIAAAPDLLAALEKCCSYLADINGCNLIDGDDCGSIYMRKRAKALQSIAFNSIAKAKGES